MSSLNRHTLVALTVATLCLFAAPVRAAIYRWDTGEMIPGTGPIMIRPGAQLNNFNTPAKNLRFGEFTGGDLAFANFENSWLDDARFIGANLAYANFRASTLTNADLSGAVVTQSHFSDTTSRGFTAAQLYSTKSYQEKNLSGIRLFYNDLTGWDFHDQNLEGADLQVSTLTNAALSGAMVTGAWFADTTSRGFTVAQLYSTKSYQEKNLSGIHLDYNNLTGWDFHDQNLAEAGLGFSTLSGVNLSGALVSGVYFNGTTSRGFTADQLYSTKSYHEKNLGGIHLDYNNLTGWDFHDQNLANANLTDATLTNANLASANLANAQLVNTTLANANLAGSTLTNANLSVADFASADLHNSTLINAFLAGANLTNADLSSSTLTNAFLAGAVVTGTRFYDTTSRGFTAAQLYSTKSYQENNLGGIQLDYNNLTGWDFHDQNLANANLNSTNLTNANLIGAVVTGAGFDSTTPSGFTAAQLYATRSYQSKDLNGIGLGNNDLTGWNFSEQNLTDAGINSSTLTNTDLSGAVVTGAGFNDTTARGFTQAQLASTSSYQTKNLSGIGLANNDLSSWDFTGQNLTRVDFHLSTLTSANLTGANLTNANLSGANLTNAYLAHSTLTSANLAGAVVTGANFGDTTSHGFTQAQLYSTQSYLDKNLTGIVLEGDHTGWDFTGQNLSGARLDSSKLTNTNLEEANLTNASLTSSNLTNANLAVANLSNADLAGAVVTGADFARATSLGFTQGQLASTASYQAKDLRGIGLRYCDLTGWDFLGQDLTGASLNYSMLADANLTGAFVSGVGFSDTTSLGFTKDQLYSTASYEAKNLTKIGLSYNDLTGWDFSGQNLTRASLGASTLTQADLSGAVVAFAYFDDTTSRGFTETQLKSTTSYQEKNLTGINLMVNDLTAWDLGGQNLSQAGFAGATLTNTDFSDAIVGGASFNDTTSRGFTKHQLYSTSSYRFKDLGAIGLAYNDLSGWDLRGQNLTRASLYGSTLTGANLTGAVVTGADFGNANLAQTQLASTASYQAKNLQGIGLWGIDLTGWDFSGQNLIGAFLQAANLANADLSFADTRGAVYPDSFHGTNLRNAIMTNGAIAGLDLNAGEVLVVRDDDGLPTPWTAARLPIPVTIQFHMTILDGGILQLAFDTDPWDSLISFEPGVPVQLGGTLDLTFAEDVDVATQVGRTLQIFDWAGVSPTGAFTVDSDYLWDLSNLYSSGEVTLVSALTGDTDGDGQVGLEDLNAVRNHFGETGAPGLPGDAIPFDGIVDLGDLNAVRNNFGAVQTAAASVPEPSGWMLAMATCLAAPLIRRRTLRIGQGCFAICVAVLCAGLASRPAHAGFRVGPEINVSPFGFFPKWSPDSTKIVFNNSTSDVIPSGDAGTET